jgi:beta-glucosidase
MDLRAMKLKHLKKVSKQAKRKRVTLWKTFAIFFLVLTLLFAPLCVAVKLADNTFASWLGGTFWKLESRDENAIYYQADAVTLQELSHQVMAEGTVLLKNEGNALPLAAGAKISFFGNDQLKTTLETEGFILTKDPASGDTAVAEYDGTNIDTLQSLSDLKKAGSLKRIVLLLTGNDVSVLKDNSYGVDAVLWLGKTPEVGAKAVAEILCGKCNPSGSLPVTLSFENTPNPYAVYQGFEGGYALYREGIYTGYRYYETRYEDFVMGTGNPGSFTYENQVAYPLGYGLSYTSFAYSDFAVTYDKNTDKFEITLTVTNTGAALGKETVQIYAQTPYTDYDRENGVEKAAVTLVGFGKTTALAPGAAEKVTISVDKRDLASYDAYGAKTYIMDAGKYYLTAATDAHNGVNNILTAKGFEAGGDAALTHTWEQTALDIKSYSTATGGSYITNRLTDADPKVYADMDLKWVSRQDWEGTLSAQNPAISVTDTLKKDLQTSRYNPVDYPVTPMPTLGAENGLKLQQLIGLPFEDARWQTLLDQLSFGDMVALLTDNFGMHPAIESVQAPGAYTKAMNEMGLPAEGILAATFNTELIAETAKAIGNTCLTEGVVTLQGAEGICYSEDGFLAGKICAAQTAGLQEKGVILALPLLTRLSFDETLDGQSAWLNEQAAREIYLRAVQYAVQQNHATAITLGNTRLGGTWTAAQTGLLTHILQKEWGGSGVVGVGNVCTAKMPVQDALLAGTTAFGEELSVAAWELRLWGNDPVIVSAMRSACHRNLYALANSCAMNGIGENTTVKTCLPWFVLTCRIAAPVCLAACIFFVIMWHRGKKKWKKTQEYLDYKTMKTTLKEEKK